MRRILAVVLVSLLAWCVGAQQLVTNPTFEKLDKQGYPVGWKGHGRVVKEGGENHLLLRPNQGFTQWVTLPEGVKTLTLRCWMKTTDVQRGKEGWQTGRLAMTFKDGNGKQVGGWPKVFGYVGTRDWTLCTRDYDVPQGAKTLEVVCGHLGKGGVVEFKNVTFTADGQQARKPVAGSASDQQLVKNPTFEKLDKQGYPVGWKGHGRVVKEGVENHLLLRPNQGFTQWVTLPEGVKTLTLRCWMKTTDVQRGKEGWQTGRLAMTFKDAKGKQVGGWPKVFGYVGTRDWTLCTRDYDVPQGAKTLEVVCGHLGKGGVVEFKNVTFTAAGQPAQKTTNAGVVEQQLVKNPTFEVLDKKGYPVGWKGHGRVVKEGGESHLVLRPNQGFTQCVSLPDGVKTLTLRCWMKTTDVQKGKEGWQTGRLAMVFKDAKGKQVGGWPQVFGYVGTRDWTLCSRDYEVPQGATTLEITCAHLGQGGTVAFKNVTFTVKGTKEPKLGQAVSTEVGRQLVTNGKFDDLDKKGYPVGWHGSGRVVKEGGESRLVLRPHEDAFQTLTLAEDVGELTLRFWMKTTDVQMGAEDWQTGRLAMAFRDARGKQVGGWPSVFGYVGTRDWTLCTRRYRVPKGATKLEFSCSHFGKGGLVEFKDVSFTVSALRMLKPGNADCPIDAVAAQSVEDAWQQRTPTRVTYSLNGLWQVRPVALGADELPGAEDCWGWFKVPHNWRENWTSDGSFRPVLPSWLLEHEPEMLQDVKQAWFKRRFKVPESWAGKSVAVDFTLLNSYAKVLVDGQVAGDVFFCGGEVEIGKFLKPGREQELAFLVKAVPIESSSTSFMAPGRAFKTKATMKGRGLCGDVYLHVRPPQRRIDFVTLVPSVSQGKLGIKVETVGLRSGSYVLATDIALPGGKVKRFVSSALALQNGILTHTAPWPDAPLWETDHPVLLTANVSLLEADGKTLVDRYTPVTFGFREFGARGKDLLLNGKVIHLRALYSRTGISNEAYVNTLDGAKDMIARARRYGFNFLITANYNFRSGQMCYFDGLLRGCAETGMLMSFAMPHVTDFNWELQKPSVRAAYTRMCRLLVRMVVNNPAVVMYAMNHNSTGYFGDQNPLKIDGRYQYESPDTDWNDLSQKGRSAHRVQAKASERIVKALDSQRLVYHHESGNLGDLHCINTYLNWSPIQERSDWMSHWSKEGVKPVFFVEWGMPHIASWSSYRGPQFIWRSYVMQSLWAAEFGATDFGDEAYALAATHGAKAIRAEDRLWTIGKPFMWWRLSSVMPSYPFYHQLMGHYGKFNWRAHRTHGVSAMLPWDQEDMWHRKTAASWQPLPYDNDLTKLKRPGLVPDGKWGEKTYLYHLGNPEDFEPTAFGKAFLRWNMPTCAYLGGPKEIFTDKQHVCRGGETLEKTVVCINDTRHAQAVTAQVECRRAGSAEVLFSRTMTGEVEVGGVAFLPFTLSAPESPQGGDYELSAKVEFANGDHWDDVFAFQVLPRPAVKQVLVQLYDPLGKTRAELQRLGYRNIRMLEAVAEPELDQLVVIGREALTGAPDLPWLKDVVARGRLLVFEQAQKVLAERLGFRTNIHGLRKLYETRGGHPILRQALGNGKAEILVADWRGESTMVEPFLKVPHVESSDPRWMWHGFENTRVWRAGNRGNVADVLIEKPVIGDWHSLLVGGFDMQYSPLLLGRNGQGLTLFCQLDVTGRTVAEPVAENLIVAMIDFVAKEPLKRQLRPVFYAGGKEARQVLQNLNIQFKDYDGQNLEGTLLVLGRGCGKVTTAGRPDRVLGLGLTQAELTNEVIGLAGLTAENGKGFAQVLPTTEDDVLGGLTNADCYWHTELTYDRLRGKGVENEALAVLDGGRVVLQQAPSWFFERKGWDNLRISQRRADGLTSRLLTNLGAQRQEGVLGKMLSENISVTEIDLLHGWRGLEDPQQVGRKGQWFLPELQQAGTWLPIEVGGVFESQRTHLADYDGWFWYRLEFTLPRDFASETVPVLNVGAVDDESWIWLNGKFLGEVTKKTHPRNYWQAARRYQLRREDLREGGRNVLVVLVNDTFNTGGIMGSPRFELKGRWDESYYVQPLAKDDDPYRYYRW